MPQPALEFANENAAAFVTAAFAIDLRSGAHPVDVTLTSGEYTATLTFTDPSGLVPVTQGTNGRRSALKTFAAALPIELLGALVTALHAGAKPQVSFNGKVGVDGQLDLQWGTSGSGTAPAATVSASEISFTPDEFSVQLNARTQTARVFLINGGVYAAVVFLAAGQLGAANDPNAARTGPSKIDAAAPIASLSAVVAALHGGARPQVKFTGAAGQEAPMNLAWSVIQA